MKRMGYIVISFLLSLTVVFMGAGISVVSCTHSQTSYLAQLSGWNGHEDSADNDCGMPSKCMSIKELRLSPMDVSHSQAYDFHPFVLDVTVIYPVQISLLEETENVSYEREIMPSPPRSYLNFIQSLLI